MRPAISALPILLLVSGCTTSTKNVYDAADVGRMISTSEGTVLASRTVAINEEPRGYGPLGGAAVGATAGGLTIGRGSGSGVAALLGGLLGAGIGYVAERTGRSREGIEYVIRTSDGRTQTLVQNRDPAEQPIPPGTPILVQHAGTYTRVIERPEGVQEPWKDPDTPSSSGAGAAGAGAAAARAGPPAQPTPPPAPPPPAGSIGAPGSPSPDPPGRYGTVRPRQQ